MNFFVGSIINPKEGEVMEAIKTDLQYQWPIIGLNISYLNVLNIISW